MQNSKERTIAKMKNKLIVWIVALLSIIFVVSAFNPRVDDWYDVSDWEVEVCSKFGGYLEAGISSFLSAAKPVDQLSYTLQAKSKSNPDGQSLYEVSYYIQPVDQAIAYKISLISIRGDAPLVIAQGSAESSGAYGYKAEYSAANYSFASLELEDNSLTVPIVRSLI
jgi:hypothetical protein